MSVDTTSMGSCGQYTVRWAVSGMRLRDCFPRMHGARCLSWCM